MPQIHQTLPHPHHDDQPGKFIRYHAKKGTGQQGLVPREIARQHVEKVNNRLKAEESVDTALSTPNTLAIA